MQRSAHMMSLPSLSRMVLLVVFAVSVALTVASGAGPEVRQMRIQADASLHAHREEAVQTASQPLVRSSLMQGDDEPEQPEEEVKEADKEDTEDKEEGNEDENSGEETEAPAAAAAPSPAPESSPSSSPSPVSVSSPSNVFDAVTDGSDADDAAFSSSPSPGLDLEAIVGTPVPKEEVEKDKEQAVAQEETAEIDAQESASKGESEDFLAEALSEPARHVVLRAMCVDNDWKDADGFGCEAYDRKCADGGLDNATDISPHALDACCACGGGTTPSDREVQIHQMASGSEAKEAVCSWVTTGHGHAWKCKGGMFVLCENNGDCQTDMNVALLGGPGWQCHIPEHLEEGMCVPADDEVHVKVHSVTPSQDDHSFFLHDRDVWTATKLSNESSYSPCCCDHVAEHSLLQSHSALSVEDPQLAAALARERKAAESLRAIVGGMKPRGEEEVVKEVKSKSCAAHSEASCTCPAAPPVVVVNFQVTSSNGVGMSGAVLRQRGAFHSTLAGECKDRPCVALRESFEGELLSVDGKETSAQLTSSESARDTPPTPGLARPKFLKELPDVPPCSEGGAGCKQEVHSYVLFLVDLSASAAQETTSTLSEDISMMYSSLCSATPSTPAAGVQALDEVPGHKKCAVYAFDGDAPQPLIPFTKGSAGTKEDMLAALKSFDSKDKSTNLYGAIGAVRNIFDSQPTNNMTTYTVVLVTDGQERAFTVPMSKVEEWRAADEDVSWYALYVMRPEVAMKERMRAEAFLCDTVLMADNAECCTGGLHKQGEKGDMAARCTVIDTESPGSMLSEDVVIDSEATASKALADVATAQDKLGADFQAEIARRTEAEMASEVKHLEEEDVSIDDGSNSTGSVKLSRAAIVKKMSEVVKEEFEERVQAMHVRIEEAKRLREKVVEARKGLVARRKAEMERHAHNAKAMVESWQRHIAVSEAMMQASQYKVGICSGFRAGDGVSSDEREAVLAASMNGKTSQHPLSFSSRTFRVPACSQATILAAMGLTPEKEAAVMPVILAASAGAPPMMGSQSTTSTSLGKTADKSSSVSLSLSILSLLSALSLSFSFAL